MKFARLGVNIDHVATLRQQRGENYPDIARAADVVLAAGANQITIHLREDRRHIQDKDVPAVHQMCRNFNVPLNLEMGCSDEMIQIAILEQPEWVCLVPEKREERTTEGGLDVLNDFNYERIKNACDSIKKNSPQTKISLFVECHKEVLLRCLEMKIDAVEIHTGDYAKEYLLGNDVDRFILNYEKSKNLIKKSGLGYHAGHGLTLDSLGPLLERNIFEEYNIGHWIVSEAVFLGLAPVVKEMLNFIKKYPLEE